MLQKVIVAICKDHVVCQELFFNILQEAWACALGLHIIALCVGPAK